MFNRSSIYEIAEQRYKTFFSKVPAFAKVTVMTGDEDVAVREAIYITNEALNFFNAVHKVNAKINDLEYLLTEGGKQKLSLKR
jgi:tellurite resistance-related uncharacterized protein